MKRNMSKDNSCSWNKSRNTRSRNPKRINFHRWKVSIDIKDRKDVQIVKIWKASRNRDNPMHKIFYPDFIIEQFTINNIVQFIQIKQSSCILSRACLLQKFHKIRDTIYENKIISIFHLFIPDQNKIFTKFSNIHDGKSLMIREIPTHRKMKKREIRVPFVNSPHFLNLDIQNF